MYHKLKLANKKVRIINLPDSLRSLLTPCPNPINGPFDVLIDTISKLEELIPIATSFLVELPSSEKTLYIIYPKKNKSLTGIHRDSLLRQGQALGLKAFSLISANEDFSCMGFKTAEAVKANKAKRPSQCVDDYQSKIEPLKEKLSVDIPLLEFYNALTPGYQKNWARFIYSAVQTKTQESRFLTLCQALKLGYKSIDQYQAAKKEAAE